MTVPRFLLDTSTAMEVLRGRRPEMRRHFNSHSTELVTSTVVATELVYGANRSADPERLRRQVQWLLDLAPPLAFDEAAASHAADVPQSSQPSGARSAPTTRSSPVMPGPGGWSSSPRT